MCVLRVSCGKPSNTAIHLHFLLVYKFILLPISGDIWNADFLLDLPHYLSFRQTRKTDFRYPKNATRSMEVVSAAIPEARSRAQRPWRHTSCRPGPKAAARQERGNGGTINAQPRNQGAADAAPGASEMVRGPVPDLATARQRQGSEERT